MISATEPADERQRLQALRTYQILDTPPEDCFDDLTFLAAELFGAPIALVTLVDAHRQWFKSHHGLDVTETPREVAFCAHAILDDGPFVVNDSNVDPRFFDNPLVTNDPNVRFYVGSPLISPEGHALGTLCVIDHVPRTATPRQLELLRRLGRQVVAQLELRRSEKRYRLLVEDQSEMISLADVDGKLTFVNQAYAALFGLTPDQVVGSNLYDYLPETQRAPVRQLLQRVCDSKSTLSGENQLAYPGGGHRWISWINRAILNDQGCVTGIHSVGRDITDRKQVEAQLTQTNERFAVAAEAAGLGFWEFDIGANTLEWDDQMYALYGRSRLEGLQPYALWADQLHPDDRLRCEQELAATISDSQPFDTQFRVIHPDRSIRWIKAAARVTRDEESRAIRMFGVNFDVTEINQKRNQLAAALRETEGLLNTLHRHAMVSIADVHGRITDANAAFCTISGYRHEELLGQDHRIVGSGTHTREFWADLWGHISRGKPWRGEICNRAKNGSIYWVDSIIAPFLGDDGRITKYISIRFNITAQKDAQRRANESESFLQRVEQVSGVGGFMMDLKLGELRLTHQSYRIYDLEQRTPGSNDLVDAYVPRNIRERLLDVAIHSQASGRTYDIEAPTTTEAGRKIWVRTAGEVEYEDGTPIRVVGAIQDVTERRTLEHRLRDVIAVAERANKAKSEFLANMSHEIRTPLNAVIGLGYLLEQTSLSDDQQQFLKKIQFAGRALLSVVNNVLDLSKIEAGEMALESEAFDLRELIRDVSQMLSSPAEQKGVKLLMRTHADLPRMAIGDTTRLRQVVINLINNAIKFTDVGQVTLEVSGVEQSAERLRLRCVVTDTGIGIEARAIERLFTPFNQADTSTTRRFGGTGLGLSITRRLIELMGGEIGVTSTVGVGSSFWIEVPLRIARGNDGTAVVRGMRILIADARGDAPEGLAPMIRSLGWTPVVADSEAELLSVLSKTPTDAYPNVLMMELNWHGASAHELISRLESQSSIAQLPPIIVVAERIADYQDHAPLMRSTDSLLVRPLTSSALFNAVSAAVARAADWPQPLLQSTIFDEKHAQWLVGVRVLVVDDSEINLEVARRILEKQGAIVALCTDGQGAVDHVRAHSTSLDIVLMDVQMPVLDGNEATKIIREQLLVALPIVALTAGALVGERQRSLDAGMTEFVSKPFDPLGLIRKVRRLVEAHRGTPIPMTVLDVATASDAVADARRPLVPSVDATVVQQMFGEDLSLFESLLARLLRDYADLALPAAPTVDDAATREELRRRVHKLKGSAGMIGATGVARLAGAAEAALQQSRPADAILQKLASALITLREEARPLLNRQAKRHAEAPTRAPDAHLEAAEIQELHALLHSQNLAAIDKFSALSPSLSEALGAERFRQLSTAVDNLEFTHGADLLRETLGVALAS